MGPEEGAGDRGAVRITPETAQDHRAIHARTEAAFAPTPFSDGDEADCIDRLRRDGDLTLFLVARASRPPAC